MKPMGRSLFRTHQDKAHGGGVQGVHQVNDLFAGEAKNELHSLVFQAPCQELRYVHFANPAVETSKISAKTKA